MHMRVCILYTVYYMDSILWKDPIFGDPLNRLKKMVLRIPLLNYVFNRLLSNLIVGPLFAKKKEV